MQSRLLFVHTLSPLHAGTGQSIGAVDLPIARDRATDHPYLPGSSLKGSLRDRARSRAEAKVTAVFGPETESASEHAGAIAFGDANLLLLPVRSVAGTFAWVTSPLLLARFLRDLREVGLAEKFKLPSMPKKGICAVGDATALQVKVSTKQKIVFEDLDLISRPDPEVTKLASALGKLLFAEDELWQKLLCERFCIVHDDVFTFLARHGTEVVTRIRLEDETKTVAKGQLWTEENLPAETVLVSMMVTMPNKRTGLSDTQLVEVIARAAEGMVQLGGKATVGRGRCRLVLAGGGR